MDLVGGQPLLFPPLLTGPGHGLLVEDCFVLNQSEFHGTNDMLFGLGMDSSSRSVLEQSPVWHIDHGEVVPSGIGLPGDTHQLLIIVLGGVRSMVVLFLGIDILLHGAGLIGRSIGIVMV